MKYLIDFSKINELKKAFTYIDRTSTPYTDGGDITQSRFVEYSPKYTQGWELIGMQLVDKDGYEISDRYLKFDNFKFDYSLNDNDVRIIKAVITAALGEIANKSWIEGFKFESNKAYATILLGKLGMLFSKDGEDKYYTPILKYPSGREGNTFWLSAEFDKGEQWAKTVIVTKPDISNNEIEHNGIALLQSTYRKLWQAENDKRRREERPLLPETAIKQVNAAAYVKSNVIIRETGEKQFFVIYVQGSKYNPIDFARKVCGANITLDVPRITVATEKPAKRTYQKSPNFFYYNPMDNPRNKYLLDKYKDNIAKLAEIKELIGRLKLFLYQDPETNKFEYVILNRVLKTGPNVTYKRLELIDPKGKKKGTFTIDVKSGDKLRIPVIDEENPGQIKFFEVKVGQVNARDNKRLTVG